MAKFIPSADSVFKTMASIFVKGVCESPARLGVDREDATALAEAFARFDAAYQSFGSEKSPTATRLKNEARVDTERRIRQIAGVIRANAKVGDAERMALGIPLRSGKPRQRMCPQEPPKLRFVQALHRNASVTPTHELKFLSLNRKPRPEGATRLELFVDLVHPDDPIPHHPGENHGGRPWYLRSFTRSPIRITPPLANVPMRVVYWARWADASGNVGPFCQTVVAWVEGGSMQHQSIRGFLPGKRHETFTVEQGPARRNERANEPARRDPAYTVALIEAHVMSLLNPPSPQHALPAPEEDNESTAIEAA